MLSTSLSQDLYIFLDCVWTIQSAESAINRVLHTFSSTPFSDTGNGSLVFVGLWGQKGTHLFVHAQVCMHR